MLQGLWPYWMDAPCRHAAAEPPAGPPQSAVPNDVRLGRDVMLLTGANMSGKSTLMRAAMAAALLSNVGLPVPCARARTPPVRPPPVPYTLCLCIAAITSTDAGCRRWLLPEKTPCGGPAVCVVLLPKLRRRQPRRAPLWPRARVRGNADALPPRTASR